MKLRKIKEADDFKMAAIIRASLKNAGLDIPGTAYFDPELNHLSNHYKTEENAGYWVLEDESGEVIGGVGIAPWDALDKICELQKLYIADTHLGKGYSKILMDQALDFAKAHYEQCYLETMAALSVANQLYEKYGFKKLEAPLDGSLHHTMDTWFLKRL